MIGLDFDNTIVCYDPLFFRVACERGLIPRGFPAEKERIRDRLRELGKEDDWTELQAAIYGHYIADADAFPGVYEFFERCRLANLDVVIISHKTKRPYRGPDLDLRSAARQWLEANRFFESHTGLTQSDVYFEETKQAKLQRIASAGCQLFVDDLPEFLSEPDFPPNVQKILFDPERRSRRTRDIVSRHSWSEVTSYVLERFAK